MLGSVRQWAIAQDSPKRLKQWRSAAAAVALTVAIYLGLRGLRLISELLGSLPHYVILGIGILAAGMLVGVWGRFHAKRRAGWVSQMVRMERKQLLRQNQQGLRARLRETLSRTMAILGVAIARPSRLGLACGAALALVALLVQVLLGRLWPGVWNDAIRQNYLTLWQVQMAFAGFALPVLVFVIELAKDDLGVARRTAEVMIRQTYVFPITISVLLLSLVLGFGADWFLSTRSYQLALVVLSATVVLTLFAYGQALSLMFDRARLKREGKRLLLEKLASSVDASIDERIGVGLLLRFAGELGIRGGLPPSFGDGRYLVLRARSTGAIADVNVWHLEEFVKQLPRKQAQDGRVPKGTELPSTDDETTVSGPSTEPIAMLGLLGEAVQGSETGLLSLLVAHYGPLNRDVLEDRLKTVYRIEPRDE